MIKKVFVGVLLAAVFGLLVFGAVNRTMAKAVDNELLAVGESISAGYGGGNGNGGAYQNQTLDGGPDDCIADGEAYGVGTGAGPGFAAGNTEPPLDGTGYGFGAVDPNAGFGAGLGGQPDGAPADGTGDGLTDVDEWITTTGVVESVASDVWVITLEDGSVLELDRRTLSYITEQGFTVNPGDTLILTGFYDDGIFEIGQVKDLTTGDSTLVRDDDGRPLWSGGRRGGRRND